MAKKPAKEESEEVSARSDSEASTMGDDESQTGEAPTGVASGAELVSGSEIVEASASEVSEASGGSNVSEASGGSEASGDATSDVASDDSEQTAETPKGKALSARGKK